MIDISFFSTLLFCYNNIKLLNSVHLHSCSIFSVHVQVDLKQLKVTWEKKKIETLNIYNILTHKTGMTGAHFSTGCTVWTMSITDIVA